MINDNLYSTQINEIEGEIASLKITLNNTSEQSRKKEIEAEIEQLEKQKEFIKNRFRMNRTSKNRFKEKYCYNNTEEYVYDDYSGPIGPNEKGEEYEER